MRKAQHVKIALEREVEARGVSSGFESVRFAHRALPEIDFDAIDTSATFLGKKLQAPFMITATTGGFEGAEKINREIAAACEQEGVAFGLGSQRAMIENPKLESSFRVRSVAPSILLCGNLGAAQLSHYPCKSVSHALKEVGADALCVHLNALQEAVQPEGDKNWEGCLSAIERACGELGFPIIAKETGAGISGETARELANAGVKAIDVSGVGGTTWSGVESYRGAPKIGGTFWDWGLSTLESLRECREATKLPLIASGGIRSGLDAAKSIRMGATIAGAALPFLKAHAKGGKKGVADEIKRWKYELKTAMFLTRSKSLPELSKARLMSANGNHY